MVVEYFARGFYRFNYIGRNKILTTEGVFGHFTRCVFYKKRE